jgi:hypothetical protein
MNNVFESIQDDIDWRLLELKEYENIIENLNTNETDRREKQVKIILRCSIPIIYAHWEGFVNYSLELVFKYLNEKKFNNQDFCCTYLTTAYEETLKSLDKSLNFEKRKKHLTNLYEKFDKCVVLPIKINTSSNLNFEVLQSICEKTNLDIKKFDSIKAKLNRLIHLRNSIAHGENAFNFDDFDEIQGHIDLLENLMSIFQNEIQDLLKNEKYKKEVE